MVSLCLRAGGELARDKSSVICPRLVATHLYNARLIIVVYELGLVGDRQGKGAGP